MVPNWMFQQLTDKTKKKKNTVHFMKRSTRMRVAALKKHRPFYEAVDAHARRRLKKTPSIL